MALNIIYIRINAGWIWSEQRRILDDIQDETEERFHRLLREAREAGEPFHFFKFLNTFYFIYFKGNLGFFFGLMESWKIFLNQRIAFLE